MTIHTNAADAAAQVQSVESVESDRSAWSAQGAWSATDEQFFRITAGLVSPSFAMGAGVLLASYDPEPLAADPRPTAPARQ
jgi:hypothetical protein